MTFHTYQNGQLVQTRDVPDPATPVVRTPREILDALKASGKWDLIFAAAQDSSDLTYWLYQTLGGNVQSDDPKTIAGCQWAVSSGLLTSEECQLIFGVTV